MRANKQTKKTLQHILAEFRQDLSCGPRAGPGIGQHQLSRERRKLQRRRQPPVDQHCYTAHHWRWTSRRRLADSKHPFPSEKYHAVGPASTLSPAPMLTRLVGPRPASPTPVRRPPSRQVLQASVIARSVSHSVLRFVATHLPVPRSAGEELERAGRSRAGLGARRDE